MNRSFLLLCALLAACSGAENNADSDTSLDTELGTEADTEADTDVVTAVVFVEFVADNEGLDTDEADQFEDWLVLENRGTGPVNLSGWQLSDDYPAEVPWVFPDDTALGAGETLRVWCDDDADDGNMHADFKLSADGETIVLLDPDGNVVEEVTFPALGVDERYVRDDADGWSVVTE